MNKLFVLILALSLFTFVVPARAAGYLQVSPNPVSTGNAYTISGCGFKRTEFTRLTLIAPSGATKIVGGWLGRDGCLYADGDLTPLVVMDFSSEIGTYRIDMRMLFVGPSGIVASTAFSVQ